MMRRLLLICGVAALLGSGVAAQRTSADVRGTIKDEAGGPAVGAAVTLTDARQRPRTMATNANGEYAFHVLETGPYELAVVQYGFAPVSRHIDLQPGKTVTLDVTLRLAIEQRVEVISSIEDFRRATGLNPSGLVLGPEQLAMLPNDPEAMLTVLRELSAATGRADEVKVYVDGQPVSSRLPPKDAIQSIRISTNSFAPEFAQPSSGLVEIVTKPASKNFRGEWQGTLNDSRLNAANAFEDPKRPTRTQGYSGYLSGPIVPSRWSFLAYGGHWERDERLIVSTTVVDPVRLSVQPFVQSVETPNTIDSYSLRTDVTVTPRHLVTFEFAKQIDTQRNAGLESGFDLPERGINRDTEDDTGRLAVVSMFRRRVTSEVRLQVRRQSSLVAALTNAPAVLVLDAFNEGGNQASLRQHRITREGTINGALSYNGDRHTFRGGVNADVVDLNEQRFNNPGGTFIFGTQVDAAGNVLATPIESYLRTLQNLPGYGPSWFSISRGETAVDFRDWQASWFAQDDMRLSPNVTLSLGLRHDLQEQASSRLLDLAPRAGIAWTPNGSRRHTLRAAAGLFYGRISPEVTLDPLRYDQVAELVVDRPAFFPTIPSTLDATVALPTVRLKGEVEAPRTAAFTVGYEWQATRTFTASVDYLRSRGDRLLRSRNLNAPDPIVGLRPFADRGPTLQFESTGHSDTERLRATLRRVFTRVSLFSTYVHGDSRSDTDGPYTVAANSRTLQGEYGRAADDERHHLVLGTVILLPREWNVSGLFTASSGRPFNITTGWDNDGDLLFVDRPAAGTAGAPGVVTTPLGSFDLHLDPGEPMIPRNAGQGPKQLVLNVGVAKTVRFATGGSGPYLILSISGENVLNRVNFADFNGVVTSPLFGQANRALNPRRIDVAARIGF